MVPFWGPTPPHGISTVQGFSVSDPPEEVFWPPKKSSKNRPLNFHTFRVFFSVFVIFPINSEPFWVNSGTPWASFFDVFLGYRFCRVFWSILSQISKKQKKWKVLKTLRLCIDLGGRQVEKIARGFENMHRFFHQIFMQNWWKSKPESEKNDHR